MREAHMFVALCKDFSVLGTQIQVVFFNSSLISGPAEGEEQHQYDRQILFGLRSCDRLALYRSHNACGSARAH